MIFILWFWKLVSLPRKARKLLHWVSDFHSLDSDFHSSKHIEIFILWFWKLEDSEKAVTLVFCTLSYYIGSGYGFSFDFWHVKLMI